MLQNCCCVSDGLERLGWLFLVKLVIWSSRTLYNVLALFAVDSVIAVILIMQSIIFPLWRHSC